MEGNADRHMEKQKLNKFHNHVKYSKILGILLK